MPLFAAWPLQGIDVDLGHLAAIRKQVDLVNAKLVGNLADRFWLSLSGNLGVAGHSEVLLGDEVFQISQA